MALAEEMDAPVWAAPSSERPPFPKDHPLYLGDLPFAIGPLARHLDGHDLAVVVGAPVFRYYPLRPWRLPARRIAAVACPALTIEQLLPLIPQGARRQPLQPPLPHRMSPLPQTSVAAAHAAGRQSARDVFDELRRICPADAVLVEETPSNLGDLYAAWPITQPDAFYTMASGGLGWSAPASVGIAPAERDSRRNPASRHGDRRRVLPVLAAVPLDRSPAPAADSVGRPVQQRIRDSQSIRRRLTRRTQARNS